MRIITPGHDYEVNDTQGNPCNTLNFVNKQNGQNLDGTTSEEVIDVMIDRLNFLNNLFPCNENGIALHHLTMARKALDDRTADRIRRGVEGKQLS